jgi:hypothetical protein
MVRVVSARCLVGVSVMLQCVLTVQAVLGLALVAASIQQDERPQCSNPIKHMRGGSAVTHTTGGEAQASRFWLGCCCCC